MRLRLWLYVLCWQYTAADTSWESTAATYGPKSSRERGRCRCGVGGPSRRGTVSYRASSSSPCPARTRSPGKGCVLRFLALFLFKIKVFYLTLIVDLAVKWVKTQLDKRSFLSCCISEHPENLFTIYLSWVQTENQLSDKVLSSCLLWRLCHFRL